MEFNSNASNQDLYSDCRFWCGIASSDTTTYPLADFTRSANFGLDKTIANIMRADNTWHYDDQNNTDLPLVYTALVSGQSDYGLSVAHLKVVRVRVQDAQGNWITLEPKDRRTLSDTELAATGAPRSYDLDANSVFLTPSPNYSVANNGSQETGLEIQIQRGASYFATTDATKTPGFASQFHRLISLYAALDYCMVNDLDKRSQKIQAAITTMENALVEFYSSRDADMKVNLTVKREDYGESALGNGFSRNPDGF